MPIVLKEGDRAPGTFHIHDQDVWGELVLSGLSTELKLRTEQRPIDLAVPELVHGRLHDFTLVSCIHCIRGGVPSTWTTFDGATAWSWNMFPHYITTGRRHFDPGTDKIDKVWFSTTDLTRVFSDFDAFGTCSISPSNLQTAIDPASSNGKPLPYGPHPRIAYFAGNDKLLEATLSFGKLEVQHWISPVNGSDRAGIQSNMRIKIEFNVAATLEQCLDHVFAVAQFLSLIAGRAQSIEDIQLDPEGSGDQDIPLILYWSCAPRQGLDHDEQEPDLFDLPLDGIGKSSEFKDVMENWFYPQERDVARARLYACRKSGNQFDIDRLVAAANLFDLTEVLLDTQISPELAKVRDECLTALRSLSRSDDRDSAIMALSRIGSPTLMKKVLARANLLKRHFHLECLDKVLRQAVLCRNYFVHGTGDKRFNYAAVEPFTSFLTEALEFVFAASELISCGWNATHWSNRPHSGGHWFARFIHEYPTASKQLLLATEPRRP